MVAALPEEVLELIASGVDVYVATCDRELEPESVLAMGLRVSEDRTLLTVYVPEVLADVTRMNLSVNPEVAITVEHSIDSKAAQIKGRSIATRSSSEADREFQTMFRASFVENFALVGIPRSLTRRLVWWPSLVVDVRIRDIFLQTPGPHAGEPLSIR
ncbi:MAG: hypothetical protein WDO74_29455 [Pseudomonadota bacterium]